MLKVSADELRRIMALKHNIRNVSLISHVGHGKSTLRDCLVAASGMVAQEVASDSNMIDTSDDEEKPIRMIKKSTGISLCYEMNDDALQEFKGERQGNTYLLSLIDTPGHFDFYSEVSSALRVTDGALVVVDCIDGVSVQTTTVLYQALSENIRPVLVVNKMDRLFLDLQVDGEEVYQKKFSVIDDVNSIIATSECSPLGNCQVDPRKGIVFSAGLDGWAFTLTYFAKKYALKSSKENKANWMKRLWGDNFYDFETRKWTTKHTGSPTCKRGFVLFCYEQIKRIIDLCMRNEKAKLPESLRSLIPTLKFENIKDKNLFNHVMQAWLPAGNALFEMVIFHLPSPAKAQEYRVKSLYKGGLDDPYAKAIRNCDPNGPLMLYVSKLFPHSKKDKFFAFGRVFSGKVSTGMKVRIMGPKYVHGERKDLKIGTVEGTVIWMAKEQETVEDVPCGNTVAMVGLDEFITKNATITNENEVNAHPICAMNFLVSPSVHLSVECNNASDRLKLKQGVKCLNKSDQRVVCSNVSGGKCFISGVGELHLQTCLNDLQDFMGGAEIIKSDYFVSFHETVQGARPDNEVVSESPNKKNRLFMAARPMEEKEFAFALKEQGCTVPRDDPLNHMFSDKIVLENDFVKRIWCLGPQTTGLNMVMNMCKEVQYLDEIKDSVIAGFQKASEEGAMTGEKMRGVCFELFDAKLHADEKLRSADQITSTAKNVIYASQLASEPRLLEPMYLVEIQAPKEAGRAIRGVVSQRRGYVFENTKKHVNPLHHFKAYLPVIESFGFSRSLEIATSGQAVAQCVFDHWDTIGSDPLMADTQAAALVAKIRKRKNLTEPMAQLAKFGKKCELP